MKRHSTDLVSVIFGLIFVAIAGWWLVGRYVHVSVPHGGWVLAGALIVIGLLGVVGSFRGDRSRELAPASIPASMPGSAPPAFDRYATAETPTVQPPAASAPTPTTAEEPGETPAAEPTDKPTDAVGDHRPGTGDESY